MINAHVVTLDGTEAAPQLSPSDAAELAKLAAEATHDRGLMTNLLTVLARRAGGTLTITHEEFLEIEHCILSASGNEHEGVTLSVSLATGAPE